MNNKEEFKIPKWGKEILKKGGGILKEKHRNLLLAMANKYERDFIPYLAELQLGIGQSNLPKDILNSFDYILKRINIFIIKSKQLSTSYDLISEELIEELFSSSQDIENMMVYFKELKDSDTSFNQIAKNLTEKKGLSLEQIKSTHGAINIKLKGLVTPPTFEEKLGSFRNKYPEIYSTGSALGKGILKTFGPYGQIASFIGGVISNYRKKINQERVLKETESLAGQLSSISESPLEVQNMRKKLAGIETSGPIKSENLYGYTKKRSEESILTRLFNRPKEDVGIATGAGLFSFFNIGWKKAFWTKRILELLDEKGKGGIVEGKKEGSLNKIEDIIGSLKRLLPGLIKFGLPITGIGMALWDSFKGANKAGDWFKTDKPTLGQKVAGGFGGFLGGISGGLGKDSWGGVLKNSLWGAGKGALIGSAFGPMGSLIGGGVGLAGSLIGGERISKFAHGDYGLANSLSFLGPIGTIIGSILDLKKGKKEVNLIGEKSILGKNFEEDFSENKLSKEFKEFSKLSVNTNTELSKYTISMATNIEEMTKEMKNTNRKSIPIVVGEPDEIAALNRGNLGVA
jgi:hypothetical protein